MALTERQGVALTNPLWQPHRDHSKEAAQAMTLFRQVSGPLWTVLTVERMRVREDDDSESWHWHAMAGARGHDGRIPLDKLTQEGHKALIRAVWHLLKGVGHSNRTKAHPAKHSLHLFRPLAGAEIMKAETARPAPLPHVHVRPRRR